MDWGRVGGPPKVAPNQLENLGLYRKGMGTREVYSLQQTRDRAGVSTVCFRAPSSGRDDNILRNRAGGESAAELETWGARYSGRDSSSGS